MALNVVLFGPPGAGKGTQGERFAKTHRIPKISTGDILREAVQHGTEIGQRARAIMARGELVSDDVMIGIARERLEQDDVRDGFVLDGFPRTVAQAKALDEIMAGRDPLIVAEIVVPEAELVRRLSIRMVCENCGATAGVGDESANGAGGKVAGCRRCNGRLVQRSDDDDAIVRERLRVYTRLTQPLVEYYHTRSTFRSVNGTKSPDSVAEDLGAAIEAAGLGQVVKESRL